MKHFTTEEWIDFANAAVAGSKRHQMERHLEEGCPRCKKLMSLWQKVRLTAKSAAEWEPPEQAGRIAKAGFSAVRLAGKPARSARLVEVLFDSFLKPLLQGGLTSD